MGFLDTESDVGGFSEDNQNEDRKMLETGFY